MQREPLIKLLSHKSPKKRLKAIRLLKKAEGEDKSLVPQRKKDSGSLSIHTFYSFSPYSPALAVYMAYKNGLECVAISDHDNVTGAWEFCRAAELLGIEATAGIQLRARFYKDKQRWLNNIYEKDIGFVSLRGIPSTEWDALNKEIASIRSKRAERDKIMVEKFNSRIKKYGLNINFEKDVKAFSKYLDGGSITERHILFAFAEKLIKKFGYAQDILDFIENTLKVKIEEEYRSALSNINNPYFAYDLVNCLKSEIKFFYTPATDAIDVLDAVAFAKKYGAILVYSYIGETRRVYEGDETVIKLEDEYLPELIKDLASFGFDAVEYNPFAVSLEKAENIEKLVKESGMFTLPCADINSPRQNFAEVGARTNEELDRNMWAVFGHGKSASYDICDGLNSEKSKAKNSDLTVRLKLYAEIGKLKLK